MVPLKTKYKIGKMRVKLKNREKNRNKTKEILDYYRNKNIDNDMKILLDNIKKKGISNFPYEWAEFDYDDINNITVYFDDVKK